MSAATPKGPLRRRPEERGRARRPARPARPRAKARANPGVSKLQAARRVGIPPPAAALGSGLVLLTGLAALLATGGRAQAVSSVVRTAAASRLASLGFRVSSIHLQGASGAAAPAIMAAAGVKPGSPILAVDLAAVQSRVQSVEWVKDAKVMRLLPNSIVIAVDQRPLVAVWQHQGRTDVIMASGAVASGADPAHFTGLPLVVGDGANEDLGPILGEISRRPALARRLQALVRVDDRRWDLDLKNGGVVALPADDPDAALRRLDDLEREARILDLGLARIDLRDPQMVVVRPAPPTAPSAPPISGSAPGATGVETSRGAQA